MEEIIKSIKKRIEENKYDPEALMKIFEEIEKYYHKENIKNNKL